MFQSLLSPALGILYGEECQLSDLVLPKTVLAVFHVFKGSSGKKFILVHYLAANLSHGIYTQNLI